MKHVFSNSDQVLHLFANKSQDHARCSNVYFNGSSCFSYGSHYKLGLHLPGGAILINNKGYSATTSKHIWSLTSGSRHKKQFFANDVLLHYAYYQIKDLADKLPKARSRKADYISEIKEIFTNFLEFQDYAKEKKIKSFVWDRNEKIKVKADQRSKEFKFIKRVYLGVFSENLDQLENEISEKQRKKDKKYRLAVQRRAKAKAKKEAEQIRKFKNFEHIDRVRLDFDVLRLSRAKEQVQTSQGVNIGVKEAKKIIKMLFSYIKYIKLRSENPNLPIKCLLDVSLIGKAVTDINGHKFTITSFKNNILKVGCHSVKLEEIKKIEEEIKSEPLFNNY